jgi:hypothetical protein
VPASARRRRLQTLSAAKGVRAIPESGMPRIPPPGRGVDPP